MKALILSILATFFMTVATAQPAGPRGSHQAKPDHYILIHAGTLLAVPGKKPQSNMTVVVKNDRIERVEKGFRIILQEKNVKAILINIFGGIVRCDRPAHGTVDAYKNLGTIDIPIVVRLQGTNAEEGKALIDNSGLEVSSAITLQDAADRVKEIVA